MKLFFKLYLSNLKKKKVTAVTAVAAWPPINEKSKSLRNTKFGIHKLFF